CCSRNRIAPHYAKFFFPSSTTAAVQEKSIQQVTLFPFFCNGISITVSSDFLTHPILDYNPSSLLLQQLLLKKSIQQLFFSFFYSSFCSRNRWLFPSSPTAAGWKIVFPKHFFPSSPTADQQEID
ncbi:hypothetical protein LINPERPRIM_LOCUS23971, partial [Linum perenne]